MPSACPLSDLNTGTSMDTHLVSIVSPVYNEGAVIRDFVTRLEASLRPLADRYSFEVVLVNDGSQDQSLEVMRERCRDTDLNLRILDLQRNYGQSAALQAGIDAARGELVISMDSDLQHFPEEIPAFLDTLEQGWDVVCGWRHQRREGIIRRWPSRAANLLIKAISGLKLHDFGTTFRAYRATAIKDVRLYRDLHRVVPVLASIAGARVTEIPIQNVVRPAGTSNYGIWRTYGVMLDLLLLLFEVRFMQRPLRAFGAVGTLLLSAGTGIILSLSAYAYATGLHMVQERLGWFLAAFVMVLAGIQVMLIGVLAEVLARIYYNTGPARIYRVRAEYGGTAGEATRDRSGSSPERDTQ